MNPVNLKNATSIYFIGIKGVAMTGLAVICKQRGLDVRGSDVAEKFITDKLLLEHNIVVFENFAAANLDYSPEVVVVGSSWPNDHPEVQAAKKSKANVISDAQLRGLLSNEKKTIAITGVHGKTTTTALMAHVFSQAGLKPSYLIGTGAVPDLKGNAAWNMGKHFIVEGDEYSRSYDDPTPKFLDLHSAISVITSLEWEHVDIYKNLAEIEAVFEKLVQQTKELIVACGDWPSVQKVIVDAPVEVITYGFDQKNHWVAADVRTQYDKTLFKVSHQGEEVGEFSLQLAGRHNVLNALAVIIVAHHQGIRLNQIKQQLQSFQGAERRFDVSERNGITFVDDYAHHPTEILHTLEAIRHRYSDKEIWCVFQPHMASRTRALLKDFATVFKQADHVVLADIFASAREQAEDITSKDLAQEITANHADVVHPGDLNEVINYIEPKIKPGMVLVTMGAGDVYRVRDKILEKLKLSE